VSKILKWIEGGTQKPATLWLFEKVLLLWLIVHAVYHLPLRNLFWGVNSLFKVSNSSEGLIMNLYYMLCYNKALATWVFAIHIVAIIWSLIGRYTWISKPLIYLTGYMLYYSAYYTFNSGFLLCILWVFFLIPLRVNSDKPNAGVINNLVLVACMIQFLLVYSIAGMTKWTGTDWLEGSGLYYALHLEHYSPAWVRETFLGSTILLMIFNYGALLYQSTFPLLIWIKRIKAPLLVVGCLFHLGIAVMLNLWDFGMAMIVGYTLFLDEKWIAGILRYLPKKLLGKKVVEAIA